MDLQTTFYVMGIAFMSLFVILFAAMLILVFYIWRKVNQMQQFIEEKINDFTNRPGEMAIDIGTAVMNKAVKKVQSFMK